ncbi:hypothetical protein b3_0145 [Synechococcus phage B3]|nr:hypothetical protein b3_0145 [Synechococcus phage B3]QGT54759.1 hypothetical protein b23_0144 [Synechococcus phage B23]
MKSFFNWLGMKYHNHKWVIVKEMPIKIVETGWYPSTKEGVKIISRCEICGALKHKDIYPHAT